jgi:hypothetical protein
MSLGRTGAERAPRPLWRPTLLFLTSRAGDDPAIAAAKTAAASGFRVALLPWHAVGFRLDHAVALGGTIRDGTGAVRELAPGERLAPDAVAALSPLDPAGMRVLETLARLYPRAMLGTTDLLPPPRAMPAAIHVGVVALAPLAVRAADAAAAGRLSAVAETLCRWRPEAMLPPIDDPRRMVLPVLAEVEGETAWSGFRADAGMPIPGDLLALWLDAVHGRVPPPPPLLLPGSAGDGDAAALDRLHPLAAVLPCLAEGHVTVATAARTDASFAWLDPALRFHDGADPDTLLTFLGRTIVADAPPEDAGGERLVEPGVGRTVLLDGLALADRPDLLDFSALGVGVTPYASGGYVNVGRNIDGLAGLDRAQHRRRCAERLEAAGCRAGRVVAVIALGDAKLNLSHARDIPAGIAVRGFRSVLRVKQLDPVAPFLHSHQHAPAAHDFLLHPALDAFAPSPPGTALHAQKTLLGLETYAINCSLSGLVAAALAPPPYAGLAAALVRRLAVIRAYAPRLLDLACSRLAVELRRDPATERPGRRDYALWFAETLGRQLAVFRRLRFLHDYHQPGVARWTDGQMHSLGENNLTLLAEFPDLDTGIFLDAPDPETLDCLFLTRADYEALSAGFEAFHQRDIAETRIVVRTLAFIALDGDAAGLAEVEARFAAAYHQHGKAP